MTLRMQQEEIVGNWYCTLEVGTTVYSFWAAYVGEAFNKASQLFYEKAS